MQWFQREGDKRHVVVVVINKDERERELRCNFLKQVGKICRKMCMSAKLQEVIGMEELWRGIVKGACNFSTQGKHTQLLQICLVNSQQKSKLLNSYLININ